MGKHTLDKHNSLSKKHSPVSNSPRTQHSFSFNDHTFNQHTMNCSQELFETIVENDEDEFPDQSRVAEEIDQFTNTLSTINDKSSSPPEAPDSIETFSKIIESRITRYNSGDTNRLFGRMTEEDAFFIEAVNRIFKLTISLSEFSSNENTNMSLNRTSLVLQHAMAFLEDEFRDLLEESGSCFEPENQQDHYSDRCVIQRDPDLDESDDYPGFSEEVVVKMHRIASAMISAGYETECFQVYSISRRNSILNQMKKLEFETVNMDDALRMPWESLEKEIWRWIKVVKNCSDIFLPGEKKLGESIFSDHPQICQSMFSNLARAVVIQLLDFAEAATMQKRSAEKLFKFLDMYEALQGLALAIGRDELCSAEIADTVNRIGQSAAGNFCELETSIKSDVARNPVPGGAVHPLTRYVMNYLEYSCEYKVTLEKIFEKNEEMEKISIHVPSSLTSHDLEKENDSPHNFENMAATTPFSVEVIKVMDLLDSNLESKSRFYRDTALRDVFLMNNGRYILQKVKGSNEIRQVMGDTWCRRRSMVVRCYHKNYQRETWTRVLQCLNHESLIVNGKVNKHLLKERFKIFTTTFDEIHKTQTTWLVNDEQLQSELRISISSVVVPAYRAFVGRFKQYFDSGKQMEKYIKYQPDDIEALIEELFEGNTNSMARRKT